VLTKEDCTGGRWQTGSDAGGLGAGSHASHVGEGREKYCEGRKNIDNTTDLLEKEFLKLSTSPTQSKNRGRCRGEQCRRKRRTPETTNKKTSTQEDVPQTMGNQPRHNRKTGLKGVPTAAGICRVKHPSGKKKKKTHQQSAR